MDSSASGAPARSRDTASPGVPQQVQVIATTAVGTRAALIEARRVASQLKLNKVVMLVPRLASSVASVESPDDDATTVATYRQLARRLGVDATVNLCICRSVREMLQWMVPRGCMVILGGRRRWWWPTREQRTADLLKHRGHLIVFADASRIDGCERWCG